MITKNQLNNIFQALVNNKTRTQNCNIYRDELNTSCCKKINHVSPRKLQRSPKLVDIRRDEILSELEEPLLPSQEYCKDNIIVKNSCCMIKDNSVVSNSNVRVKVLMTKEEAAKLLSKCKEEGILEFKDVVSELVKLPAQRVVGVASDTSTPSKDMGLDTIPEEDED